jgi:hypothetical protein
MAGRIIDQKILTQLRLIFHVHPIATDLPYAVL